MAKKNLKRCLILIPIFGLFAFTFLSSSASAQVRSTDIVLNISPESFGPNQDITATLSSYATNLDKAYISWAKNNQEMSGGVGKKVFYFTTGNLGSPVNLTATINTVDGQNIQKTITLTPSDVDLLWEAYDSYTPPFYKGKALAGSQSTFKVVAIPNLTNQTGRINSGNLSYTWTKDGNIQSDSSGWGKSSVTIQNSYLDKENIVKVKISDISGSTNSTGGITLRTVKPKVVLYQNDPTLGVQWERALGNGFQVNPDGEIIIAEPYFFLPKNINSSDLTFDWFINKEKVQTPNPKNTLSVKPNGGQSGTATIKVMINNVKTLFQSAEREITVEL